MADYLDFGIWNIAPAHVCDAYSSKPLPEGVKVEALPENHAFFLNNLIHASSECPYVIEEARALAEKDKELPESRDISKWRTPDPYDVCEMRCCETKLPFQLYRHDYYRKRTGIKPDGTEPVIKVKQIVQHEKRIIKSEKEINDIFDLSRFHSETYGDLYDRIEVAKKHIEDNCNQLGTVDLSGAVNPIKLYCGDIESPNTNPDGEIEFWVADDRTFDSREFPTGTPIRDLDRLIDGVLLCIDRRNCLPDKGHPYFGLGPFTIYGNIRPTNGKNVPRFLNHFIEVRAIYYSDVGNSWMFGVFGNGFRAQAKAGE
ncbi:hypothetical protein KY339_04090 [Candidatus Woesearchaeota archaeon]|nr:hypothetical protein [Candidatus Woesearchaeota archaeon]